MNQELLLVSNKLRHDEDVTEKWETSFLTLVFTQARKRILNEIMAQTESLQNKIDTEKLAVETVGFTRAQLIGKIRDYVMQEVSLVNQCFMRMIHWVLNIEFGPRFISVWDKMICKKSV